jgi:glycerophosphoryl diester phosphodiesterase
MTIPIGHGGASAIGPANTTASFDAALRAGVEMIEFDVRPRGHGCWWPTSLRRLAAAAA